MNRDGIDGGNVSFSTLFSFCLEFTNMYIFVGSFDFCCRLGNCLRFVDGLDDRN
jgi:hypothetical protein